MRQQTSQLLDFRAARYLAASIGALGIDLALFVLLIRADANAALASALGYMVGIVAHWLLSTRLVFGDTVARSGTARYRQKVLFVLSALGGLAVTTTIVGLADMLRCDAMLAKLVAIGVSFVLTYVIRAQIVFRLPADSGNRGSLA